MCPSSDSTNGKANGRLSKRAMRNTVNALRQPHSEDPAEGPSSLCSNGTSTYPVGPSFTVRSAVPFSEDAVLDESADRLRGTSGDDDDDDTPLTIRLLRDQLAAAKQQLRTHTSTLKERELKIRQDMFLVVLEKEEKLQKAIQTAKRYQQDSLKGIKTIQAQTASHAEEKTKLETEIQIQKSRVVRAESESRSLATQADHAHHMQRVMEEDMDELRRIHNEDIAKSREQAKKRELPPAYGSLDDDSLNDQDEYGMPPYEKHVEDSGALEVANLKRVIRETFTRDVADAQDKARAVTCPAREHAAHATMLVSICASLANAARNLDDILKRYSEVRSINVYQYAENTNTRHFFKTRTPTSGAEASFVADRTAKLLLDLALRLISALELRPYNYRLTQANKTSIALSWAAVDSTLTTALRQTFSFTTPKPSRLTDLQIYSTHIHMLQSKLHSFARLGNTAPGSTHHCGSLHALDESLAWVMDQVEKEREMVALAGRRYTYEGADGGNAQRRIAVHPLSLLGRGREGSTVSSAPARPGTREGSEDTQEW